LEGWWLAGCGKAIDRLKLVAKGRSKRFGTAEGAAEKLTSAANALLIPRRLHD